VVLPDNPTASGMRRRDRPEWRCDVPGVGNRSEEVSHRRVMSRCAGGCSGWPGDPERDGPPIQVSDDVVVCLDGQIRAERPADGTAPADSGRHRRAPLSGPSWSPPDSFDAYTPLPARRTSWPAGRLAGSPRLPGRGPVRVPRSTLPPSLRCSATVAAQRNHHRTRVQHQPPDVGRRDLRGCGGHRHARRGGQRS